MELYKYLNPTRIEVLENNLIRFSRPSDFNDPFESLPYISSVLDKEIADDFYKEHIETHLDKIKDEKLIKYFPKEDYDRIPSQYLELISSISFEQAKNLIDSKEIFKKAFTLYPDTLERSISQVIKEKWNEIFGILCLSEKYDNLIMWSHYCQNHQGFVLGLRSDSAFFDQRKSEKDPLRFLRKVQYKEERPEMTLFDPRMSDQEYGDYILDNTLLTKSIHWSKEEEWRIIFNLKDADQIKEDGNSKIYLFKFPIETVSSVYLGVCIDITLKEKIIKILKDSGNPIPIYQGYLHLKKYLLDFKEIKY
jgi:hypothetical protein